MELLHQNYPDNSSNFSVFAARAGNVALAESYLAAPMIYPHETVALTLYRPEMNASHRSATQRTRCRHRCTRSLPPLRARSLRGHRNPRRRLPRPQRRTPRPAEFQKLIDNPAVEEPTQPRTFIAHVGLARAYTLQHKTEDAKAEYKKFFALWSDADPDIPILQQARAEYAKL